MSEQRLIDVDALKEKEQYIPCGNGLLFHGVTAATIDAMPTIDPETLPLVKELREELAQVTAQRDAAIEELGGVLAMADVLTDFVDDEIYPVVSYDLYLNLRDNIDAITKWEHEEEWRGPVAENATAESEPKPQWKELDALQPIDGVEAEEGVGKNCVPGTDSERSEQ